MTDDEAADRVDALTRKILDLLHAEKATEYIAESAISMAAISLCDYIEKPIEDFCKNTTELYRDYLSAKPNPNAN